ncbi:prepilin-type N-terminal cleavage/methylation domain-containing protein [Pseudomonas massiliensis]|uniref:prepilin-type N-terminal cleavage/methylation domain-containing protein n=1 Tax=Pseudomonas massiliensis TaxID=522492 RepID=UPI00058BEC49|nr:prepilin-type N-terminal cleavage/methylation domain-containing protein [Pseudomonas massiliensis]
MTGQRGFTLLEILVVLTLMGLFLGLVGVAIVGANRALARVEAYGTQLDEVRATQAYLRRALSQALPLSAPAGDGSQPQRFVGDATTLMFFAPMAGTVVAGLQQQRVFLDDQCLMVSFAELTGGGLTPLGDAQVLLHGVSDLAFSYQGMNSLGQPTGWIAQWPWPERLPRAVRIDLRLAGAVPWVRQQVGLRMDLSSEPGL